MLQAARRSARRLTLLSLMALSFGTGGCSESKAAAGTSATGAAGSGAAAVGSSGTGTASPGAATAVEACGKTGLPDCPLQSWMKATVQAYLRANDTGRLATALEQLADKSPAGFDGWRESALQAAKAARSGDVPSIKAACKQCHDQHRSRFRNEIRSAALF